MPLLKVQPLQIDKNATHFKEFVSKRSLIRTAIVSPTKENCKAGADIAAELARRIIVEKELEVLRTNLTVLAKELLNIRKELTELEAITDADSKVVKQAKLKSLTNTINTEIIAPLLRTITPYAKKLPGSASKEIL